MFEIKKCHAILLGVLQYTHVTIQFNTQYWSLGVCDDTISS